MCDQVRKWTLGLCLLITALSGQAFATQVKIPQGATVGLVLSGGGARGLAHVGVLRVLEAQGIEPTIITGTSMGSIVGALYASGLSAQEIDRIARTMNWSQALSDASPRRDQPYPFRQLEAGMNTDVRVSITKDGIAFPKGAIEGQHLERELGNLFTRNGTALRFEELPRRFAAVAADLETGEAVIMDTGDLASAVRASMSIPGAIAPVERNGKLLVDGGIANNMPVDLARRMGADFIIAVDVSSALKTRTDLNSLFSVAQQTTAFLVQRNTLEQRQNLKSGELLIQPEMEEYGSTQFDQVDPIIAAGLRAALEAFSIAEEALPEFTDAKGGSASTLPQIDFISINNTAVISDEMVAAQISQPIGEPLDREMIERDLSKLYGLDYFSVVRYRVVEQDGEYGLEVTSVGRETGNSWLKLGLELADDFEGNSVVGLAASLRAAGLNEYGGTAFGLLELGTSPELELRFLQPVTHELTYFVEPAVGYRSDPIDLYLIADQKQPSSRYQKQDIWSSFSFGRLIWRGAGEVRVGLERQWSRLNFRGGINLGEDDEFVDDGFYFAQVGWDTLNDLGFPTSGLSWKMKVEQHNETLAAETNFLRLKLDGTLPLTWGRSTLLLEGDVEASDDDTASFTDIPFIGGFLELSGLPPRSRFGRHRGLVRGVYYRQLNENGPLPINMPMYIGMSLERGNVWFTHEDISWNNMISAGSLFVGAATPLGPAYLSYGRTEEGDHSLSIFLGQRFR